jgi:hypothetical protein
MDLFVGIFLPLRESEEAVNEKLIIHTYFVVGLFS